ncbi:pyocin activator PrtN family protein [Salinicola lusitanus]|uniref:Pyocin activator PrtN family protein n=1 Tax=Salinicola lusitanus TaxID=1949085 RepID=A0ABZ3CQU7_9GAMM
MPEITPPEWQSEDASNDSSTVALLFEQFGDVLIPLDAVRGRYFRNLNEANFRAAIREGRIDLPVITLDRSQKAQPFVCIYHLAVLIERQAHAGVKQLPSRHWRDYRRALPTTEHEKPPSLAG